MTRKHFEAIAAALADTRRYCRQLEDNSEFTDPSEILDHVLYNLSAYFETVNPLYDPARFANATRAQG